MMAGAVFATAVVVTLILAGHQLGSRLQLQEPCGPAPECLHALGGGLIASGGGFDHHVTLPQCTEQLERYAADNGAYWTEVDLAINMAFEALQLDPVCNLLPGRPHPQQQKHSKLSKQQPRKQQQQQQQQQQQGQTPARKLAAPQTPSTSAGAIYLPNQQQQQQVPGHGRFPPRPTPPPTLPPPSQDQLIIFDIDETVLSNLQHLLHPEPNTTWDDWVQAADAPALGPSRCLYLSLLSAGYSVAFLTGRGEAQRDATMRNLEAAGYGVPCTAPAAQHGEGPPSRGAAAKPAGEAGCRHINTISQQQQQLYSSPRHAPPPTPAVRTTTSLPLPPCGML
jgi:hypothetical protein